MNWLWKMLGYHVCEEFTQWRTFTLIVDVVPQIGGIPMVEYKQQCRRSYQERHCTICGAAYQRPLPHLSPSSEGASAPASD